ncbi:DUF4012 domain-containing protein [Methanobacterium alcaliphilum]|uniref:DUF4012 domain-containing protein n=1 Tax=Methanobacterium alcaliphilum TaxID=392018 RepID=UPI00200A9CD5|nr:DUF4012 domain-containing protein [Methanobacterium alcaliphilum]MCK9150503.1 DUF4012 domain-containing protein [Methanobacterium alcaliphilum]
MAKKIFGIILLLIILFSGFIFFSFVIGEHKILLLGIDPSEKRPGIGAVDMAFIITTDNGKIINKTSIYPGGMYHPNATVPQYLQSIGEKKLLLHDTFWENDTAAAAQLARETVEYHTNQKIDVTIIINPDGLDALINAAGPLTVNGEVMENVSSIEWMRDDQSQGNSRGTAVQEVMDAMLQSSKNPAKIVPLSIAAVQQYMAGNIYIFT